MNRDELKEKALELAGKAWASYRDDWRENTALAVLFTSLGWVLKGCAG